MLQLLHVLVIAMLALALTPHTRLLLFNRLLLQQLLLTPRLLLTLTLLLLLLLLSCYRQLPRSLCQQLLLQHQLLSLLLSLLLAHHTRTVCTLGLQLLLLQPLLLRQPRHQQLLHRRTTGAVAVAVEVALWSVQPVHVVRQLVHVVVFLVVHVLIRLIAGCLGWVVARQMSGSADGLSA